MLESPWQPTIPASIRDRCLEKRLSIQLTGAAKATQARDRGFETRFRETTARDTRIPVMVPGVPIVVSARRRSDLPLAERAKIVLVDCSSANASKSSGMKTVSSYKEASENVSKLYFTPCIKSSIYNV